MAKTASLRRFTKRINELRGICASEPQRFVAVWNTYVRGWLGEIHNRARAQRLGDSDERHLKIFEVFALATRMAHAAEVSSNENAASIVHKSLAVIEHECAKAVASLTDPRMYELSKCCSFRLSNASVRTRMRK